MALVKIFSFPNVGLRWLSEFSFTFAIAGLAFRSLSFFFKYLYCASREREDLAISSIWFVCAGPCM